MHFAYDLLGRPLFLAFVFPVNESVWEHLKMAFWPILFWWIIGYRTLKKKSAPSIYLWFSAALLSITVTLWLIVTLYYTYTSALNIESVVIDIIIFIIAVFIGQFIGLISYRKSSENKLKFFLALFILFILLTAFIWFTYNPPKIALFYDFHHQLYGIEKK